MSVVPILAILAHDWTGLTLFLLLLAGLICSLWRLAPRCNNASGQLRFNAYFLGATAGILAVFLLIRWDYWLAATNYPDSISGLNLAILVAGFGSLLSCYLLRHARRVKESGG